MSDTAACLELEKKYMKKPEWASFGLSAIGQNMIYAMSSLYLMAFYTDVALIDAAQVGVMMTIARVWDAINDPLMGSCVDLVDPTKSKLGKFKPFLMSVPIPMALLTILIFWMPDFSTTAGKISYMYITYILWGMVYTIGDVPFWGLASATTPNEKERSKFISVMRIFCSIGSVIPMGGMIVLEAIPALKDRVADRYMIAAIIFAILGAALFFLVSIGCKERLMVQPRGENFFRNFKSIKDNKPLMLIVIAGIVGGARLLAQTSAIYVARYCYMGSFSLFGLDMSSLGENLKFTLLNATFGVGYFLGTVVTPLLQRKFDFKQIYIGSSIFGFVVQMIMFFCGYNDVVLVMVFLLFASLSAGIYNVLTYAMIADSVDYLEWKTGERREGICFSCQTFMTKLGAGMASLITSIVLVAISFAQPLNPGEFLPQEPSVNDGIYAMVSLIPAISCLLSIIPIFFYDYVGKKKMQILEELNARREAQNNIVE